MEIIVLTTISKYSKIFSLQLEQLDEAEDALSEANILNSSDPEVWAYLSMVCLKTERQLEAEQALKYAIKVGKHHARVK